MSATVRKVTADPAPSQPGQPRRRSSSNRVVRSLTAIAVPVLWAVALIPFRDELSESVSLLMVVPVLAAAVAGGVGPGTLAALSAATAFGLFHTEPYGLPRIDHPDDVVETLVLLGLGLVIGLLVDATRGARSASQIRRVELGAVGGVLRAVADGSTVELVDRARDGIAEILGASAVAWEPGSALGDLPALASDGTVRLVDRRATDVVTTLDASALPSVFVVPGGDAGRFVVTTLPDRRTSLEERRAAWLVAAASGRWLSLGGRDA